MKNDADLLLKVGWEEKSREKNDADLLLGLDGKRKVG